MAPSLAVCGTLSLSGFRSVDLVRVDPASLASLFDQDAELFDLAAAFEAT
jgi:hypothetical protein